MRTYAICPISDKRINENVTRSNAFLSVALLVSYVFTGNLFIIAILLIDFFFRAVELPQYSLLAIVSKKLVQLLSIKPKLINAGTKIFAARIGLFFNVAILISALVGLNSVSYVLVGIFGVCAFLEAAFGFCVACQIYPFVYKLFYQSKLDIIK
jgi:ABC-type proline/glycine betaine transport system permease subunit